MADANIQQILAALASQSAAPNTPVPPQQAYPGQPQAPPSGMPLPYPGSYTTSQPVAASSYALPQPRATGAVDLSSIRPSNSGSVSLGSGGFQDALSKARGFAASKGVSYDAGRDPRGRVDSYRRSRSRSPTRIRDGGNPYRDERRDERRYPREDRGFSPRGAGGSSYGGGAAGGGAVGVMSGPDHEVIAIESNLVGLIIGQQGKNLRRVEQDTRARVQFLTGPESSGPTRQCKISGTTDARESAKAEIRRIISENGGPVRGGLAMDKVSDRGRSSQQRSQQTMTPSGGGRGPPGNDEELQIMVPDRTVGLIIGRGGETIKDLQERSGCHINILGKEYTINNLRPVNLIGSEETQRIAKDMILEVVESDNKGVAPGGGGGGGGGMGGGRGRGDDSYGGGGNNQAAGKDEDTMYVPSEAVGMIIGKGGETIKEMQNMSGCKINVSQPAGRDVNREVGLVGSRSAIESAKALIREKVHAVEEKNRGASGGGGGSSGVGGRRDQGGYDSYSQQPQQQQQAAYGGGYGQAVQGYQQQQGQGQQAGGDPAADPYAAYGGYANYVAMWMAASQQQAAQGGTPAQGQGAPPPS